jgi:hypothetical protein
LDLTEEWARARSDFNDFSRTDLIRAFATLRIRMMPVIFTPSAIAELNGEHDMSKSFIQLDSTDVWPETIAINLAGGDFSAIHDECGPSIRYIDGDEVYTIANLPKEMFVALNENPTWSRALGYALDKAHGRGRDSGLSEGAEGVQRAIRAALGLR